MNRIFVVAFCILICGCSTTHNIKVSQKHFNVLKMEHLQKENYKFEVPKLELSSSISNLVDNLFGASTISEM